MKTCILFLIGWVVAAATDVTTTGPTSFGTHVSTSVSTAADATTTMLPVMPKMAQFTILSFLTGLLVMVAFVLVPVCMMVYRNRNSIVEFIKNR